MNLWTDNEVMDTCALCRILNPSAVICVLTYIRLIKFSGTLTAHRSGILAYYDYPISTGPLEGTNNKIKTMQKQGYGYRDHVFFMLKIYALHEAK